MPLPNFLLIGAPRSGTSSFNAYLQQHPDVYMSPMKEPHFFDFVEGIPELHGHPTPSIRQWWESRITTREAYEGLFRDVHGEKAVGEATPAYLAVPGCAARIHELIPDVKLLAILRHPAERAYSHFCHNVRHGLETTSDFGAALDEEVRGVRDGWDVGWRYRAGGLYAAQLQAYLARFDRRDLLVLFYEDFCRGAIGLLATAFRFLEVDDTFVPDVSRRIGRNIGVPQHSRWRSVAGRLPAPVRAMGRALLPRAIRDRASGCLQKTVYRPPAFNPGPRAELVAFFREDVVKLQDIVHRDLRAWLE